MSKSVVLLSGGMDSTLTAKIATSENDSIAALHLNYRHRTERRELKSFNEVADELKIADRLTVDIEFLKAIGGSSLTDDRLPVSKANLQTTAIPSSYVPFRNGNFLAIAASWAEVIGASKIYIGAVEDDSSGYPDCRQSFFDIFESAIRAGTNATTPITIETPLIHFSKARIVKESIRLGSPLHLTWSCYQSEDKACGVCDSCALRLRGFEQAGVEDPIEYFVRPKYT